MPPEALHPKSTYKPKHKLEAFYTGGAARVTRDGQHIACGCGELVKVLELSSGSVVRSLKGDTEPVTALTVSPDCKTLVAASRSLTTRVYNLQTGDVLRSWRAHKAPVADLTIDASGGYVASAGADRVVKVYDIQGGFCTHNFTGHGGVVMRVLFHPKQLQLYSCADDGEVRVWDLVEKSCVAVLKGHFSAATSLALSPDGWLLLSAGRDKVVNVWDLRSNSKVTTVPVFEAVEGLAVLPLGAPYPGVAQGDTALTQKGSKKAVYFATAGEKARVKLWRSDTAACVYEQPPESTVAGGGNELVDLSLLPGGTGLLAASADARLMFYSPTDADGQRQLALTRHLIGNHDEVTDLRFVGPPSEPTHIAVATNSEAIRVFRLSSLSCTASLIGHKEAVLCLDAAPAPTGGSTILVSGSKDHEVRVWSAPAGRCLAVGTGHVGAVSAVAVSRKGRGFAVSGAADKLLKVWDISAAVAAVDDGSQGPLHLKTTAAAAAHDKDINSVAVSPNDALVASGSQDKTAKVWRLPDLVPKVTLRGHKRGVWSVEFSPVEQTLLTSSGDKTVRMWSIQDGSCLRTFEGHTASVLRATFATAGTQVLSVGADGLLKLWSCTSGECVNTGDEHEDKIWALTTGGTAESLAASGGADGVVAIWADVTADEEAAAAAAEDELYEKQQALENALVEENFVEAARLAFELKHPGRLLSTISRAASGDAAASLNSLLSNLVKAMSAEDLKTALEYCREWNTNSRNCHAAQAMLRAMLRHHKPNTILDIPGAQELLAALAVYTQRHFSRMDRLVRSTFLLDYTLATMKVLTPGEGEATEQEGVVHAVDETLERMNKVVKRKYADEEADDEDTEAPQLANGIHKPSGDDLEDDFDLDNMEPGSDHDDSEDQDQDGDKVEDMANGFASEPESEEEVPPAKKQRGSLDRLGTQSKPQVNTNTGSVNGLHGADSEDDFEGLSDGSASEEGDDSDEEDEEAGDADALGPEGSQSQDELEDGSDLSEGESGGTEDGSEGDALDASDELMEDNSGDDDSGSDGEGDSDDEEAEWLSSSSSEEAEPAATVGSRRNHPHHAAASNGHAQHHKNHQQHSASKQTPQHAHQSNGLAKSGKQAASAGRQQPSQDRRPPHGSSQQVKASQSDVQQLQLKTPPESRKQQPQQKQLPTNGSQRGQLSQQPTPHSVVKAPAGKQARGQTTETPAAGQPAKTPTQKAGAAKTPATAPVQPASKKQKVAEPATAPAKKRKQQ